MAFDVAQRKRVVGHIAHQAGRFRNDFQVVKRKIGVVLLKQKSMNEINSGSADPTGNNYREVADQLGVTFDVTGDLGLVRTIRSNPVNMRRIIGMRRSIAKRKFLAAGAGAGILLMATASRALTLFHFGTALGRGGHSVRMRGGTLAGCDCRRRRPTGRGPFAGNLTTAAARRLLLLAAVAVKVLLLPADARSARTVSLDYFACLNLRGRSCVGSSDVRAARDDVLQCSLRGLTTHFLTRSRPVTQFVQATDLRPIRPRRIFRFTPLLTG